MKEKASHPAAARDLYTSTLFVGRRAFVERSCASWFVLSAKHGLVRPETRLEPYDEALTKAGRQQRRAWSERVLQQIDGELGNVADIEFEVHAGADYRDFGLVDGLQRRGATVSIPTQGMRQGEQLGFYKRSRS